ncbi:21125_t:CDS:2 [Entrophospora sp. SA101]|nr:9094_t:CDS:2 [Entrophospora sp. SA101]CAJ0748095.1 11927_t:CDS:2 [Entrophospora sp. SA101]CAJ0753980.1 21125_t:CDS:2 [Entrophospora sp. SA101]CAJ0870132.1 10819_t:CDS:2 [Entrophospora sp. SA101]CAJ0926512.1 201_t:CDS:2 [Entrophospora sp. SA101]
MFLQGPRARHATYLVAMDISTLDGTIDAARNLETGQTYTRSIPSSASASLSGQVNQINDLDRQQSKELKQPENQLKSEQSTRIRYLEWIGRKQKVIIENAVVAATIDNGAASSVVSKLLLDELGYEIEQTTNNTLIKAVGSLPRPLGKINYFSICIGAFYTPISFDTTDVNNINYCWVEEEEYCGPTTENDEEGGEKIEEGSVRVNLNVGPLTTPQKEKFYKLVEECQDIFARDES